MKKYSIIINRMINGVEVNSTYDAWNVGEAVKMLRELRTGLSGTGAIIDLAIDGEVVKVDLDDHFAVASIFAADEGLKWHEATHAFRDPEWISAFEAGSKDPYDPEVFGSVEDEIEEAIYTDVHGYKKVTGGKGYAIVKDETLAHMCELLGWDVLPCGNPDEPLDDGSPNEWYEIREAGGEEKYFENIYAVSEEDEDAPSSSTTEETFESQLEEMFPFFEPQIVPNSRRNRWRKNKRWDNNRPGVFYGIGYIADVTIANKMFVGRNMAEGVLCRF